MILTLLQITAIRGVTLKAAVTVINVVTIIVVVPLVWWKVKDDLEVKARRVVVVVGVESGEILTTFLALSCHLQVWMSVRVMHGLHLT